MNNLRSKILIIEDDPGITGFLKTTLNAVGYEVIVTISGMDNKILRVHMASIRRKIEPSPNEPRYIMTEVGVGYRMADKEG